jgi:hypothetical protein
MRGACHSDFRFSLKSLVNRTSPADMIDKSLARMIDETLPRAGKSYVSAVENA